MEKLEKGLEYYLKILDSLQRPLYLDSENIIDEINYYKFDEENDYTFLNATFKDIRLYLAQIDKSKIDNKAFLGAIHEKLIKIKFTAKNNFEALHKIINSDSDNDNDIVGISAYYYEILYFRSTDLIDFFEMYLFQYDIKHKENNQSIDLSDTKGTEKIIMLYKMGILDFLKKQEPFNASTNLLASAISGITGVPQSTVQSYINPIDNPATEQNKNPLTSAKTVNKVIQKLTNIGYIPIK